MADYIVKNGGTAVGDAGRYTTLQTGSFASLGAANYYDNIALADAATTTPVTGDRVLVSDIHSFSTSAEIRWGELGVDYICVSDLAMEDSRRSGFMGSETGTNVADFYIENCFVTGLDLTTPDDMRITGSVTINDSELTATGSGDTALYLNDDGGSAYLVGAKINVDNAGGRPMHVRGGSVIRMVGGSVETISAGITNLTNGEFINGGGSIYLSGVDISSVVGTLIANVGSSYPNDDTIDIKFDMCKLASGVAFTNETFKSCNQRLLATRCSFTSATAEYQYHLHAFGGDVDDDSAIFRNEDEAFTESNQKISYKIVTNSDASLGFPLWFDFPVLRYSRLSAGATNTLRFYITSNTALTDKDIYIEISYPDGTNKQTPNFLTSAPTTVGGTLNLMATGTTLTNDGSSSWTGALSNLYQIDVDTSTVGNGGSDCQPIVKVYVTLPSVTIQIASEFGLN